MENSLSCFRLAQCYMTINSVKRQWQQFIRSLDSERRKRQYLINQVPWYDRRESKHLRIAYNVRSRVHQPMFGERHNAWLLLSKPPQRRFSEAVAHNFGSLHSTKKPRRYLRGDALGIDRASRRETRLSEPFRSRHQARLTIARQRSRDALNRIWCIIYRPVKMNWSQDAISK